MLFGFGCGACCKKRLVIQYDWSQNSSRDLDTATTFVGSTFGYACGGSSDYMNWNGDDTSSAGQEVVFIDYEKARQQGRWSGSVQISCKAGWYSPAGGRGNAVLRVYLDSDYGSKKELNVSPGSQSSCASKVVGTVTLREDGTFDLSPLP